MISCTEFIPAYSELFKFIDQRDGRQAVYDYWTAIFDPANSPLNACLDRSGIKGCYEYWSHTLNEEAADFTMTLDEDAGEFSIEMHKCPSKGKLLKLDYMEPFDEYCLHCDQYRQAVEKHGLCYEYDFTGSDQAQCSLLIYDPKKYKKK